MEKQSIESMYKLMFGMRDKMGELLEDAQDLVNSSKTYGGIISEVMTEQLTQYFGPKIQQLINDEKTPGSIIGMIKFMDSVPLSYTRMEPEADIVDPVDPAAPDNINVDAPATLNNDLDNLPRNASFANPENTTAAAPVATDMEEPLANENFSVEESVENKNSSLKESTRYHVIRTSTMGSTLGEAVANKEDEIVSDFDTEEEANEAAANLNETVSLPEKDAFGTEYKVVPFETLPIRDEVSEDK